MAVKIRLRRMGYKKHPIYRVIVADSRSPRDGRFIEEIGTYDPNKEPADIKIDAEAAKKWINDGAQPTDTVAKLLKVAGIDINRKMLSEMAVNDAAGFTTLAEIAKAKA